MLQTKPGERGSRGEIEDLAQFIPGGLFRCLWDEGLTLVEMSAGFLRLLGYTREEIRLVYHDSFREMIDPRDWERTQREVCRQMALGTEKELEYRMRRKDGESIWVLDKGNLVRSEDGAQSFYCLLVDITVSKQVQEELRLSLERHQIILDQTNDIIVEWDLEKDSFTYSSNWRKGFGYAPLERNVSRDLVSASHIHPEDISAFSAMLEKIRAGVPYSEAEMRLKKTDDSYLWCRMRFTAQRGESGRTIKAVGVILDIDEEKNRAQQLLRLAQKDTLTGLYNRGTAQTLIAQALKNIGEGAVSALMIIDVDNFKTVNDSKGHLFGDEFLIEISRQLARLFRGQDIVGRIGGDEFLAFMQALPNDTVALQRARQLLAVFRRESRSAGLPDSVSCSIGVAVAPRHGREFNVLYHDADIALYHAKQQGKNGYVLYDDVREESFPMVAGRERQTAVAARIDSNVTGRGGAYSLADQIFHLLYSQNSLESAISSILESIGKHFDVSRVYIFESSEDGKALRNTFEWCDRGVEPQKDKLGSLPFAEAFDDVFQRGFDENGVLYCRDISSLPPVQFEILDRQGIQSVLLCAIVDGGAYRGLVGFDECRGKRYWNQEQIDALLLLSRVVGNYLLKQRATDRAERTARELCSLLESQNAWIYVIRPGTYELLYINRKTLDLDPQVQLGMRCHEAFFGRSAPCVRCPVRAAEREAHGGSQKRLPPRCPVWSEADAVRIVWRGEDAVLVTRRDIGAQIPP